MEGHIEGAQGRSRPERGVAADRPRPDLKRSQSPSADDAPPGGLDGAAFIMARTGCCCPASAASNPPAYPIAGWGRVEGGQAISSKRRDAGGFAALLRATRARMGGRARERGSGGARQSALAPFCVIGEELTGDGQRALGGCRTLRRGVFGGGRDMVIVMVVVVAASPACQAPQRPPSKPTVTRDGAGPPAASQPAIHLLKRARTSDSQESPDATRGARILASLSWRLA
jgi:hypothetical protein